jgi:murein DD-endopeptidase MepM/ murein hydrolase activator NlpD
MPIERCDAQSPTDPRISRLASRYGVRPGRTSGAPTYHAGLDFAGKAGDPVRAAFGGYVVKIAKDSERARGFDGYGNAVVLFHPALNLYSFYAHLSKVYAVPDTAVPAGYLIGAIGNTTNGKFKGMGAHLHFEMRKPLPNGKMPFPAPYRTYNVDPLPHLVSSGVQITPSGEIRENCPLPVA